MKKVLQKVVILGAGGFGREVLDVFDAVNQIDPIFDVIGFIVDSHYGKPGAFINDKPILGDLGWFQKNKDVKAICGIGEPHKRHEVVMRAKRLGVNFCSIIHPGASLTRWVRIGEGTVITQGSILTNQIQLGDHVHINLDCTIGHDVVIEDFVTLSPGVHVSGNVALRRGCYIGTGSNIIENIAVGGWSIIGAGSTVITDIPDNTIVVGVPAKVIKTRENEWHLK